MKGKVSYNQIQLELPSKKDFFSVCMLKDFAECRIGKISFFFF